MWYASERRVFLGKLKGKRPIERPKHRLEDNTRTNHNETGWGLRGVDWIHLVQEKDKWRALMNMVMYLQVPKNKMLGIS
jgi:hypothetical protein